MEDKIKVYVCSLESLKLDFVGRDSMGHPNCHQLPEFKHIPTGSWDGYFTDEQSKVLDEVSRFCKENGLEYEIVDITNLSFISKTKLVFKGIKAPTITFKGKKIEGVPTKEDLKVLIAE